MAAPNNHQLEHQDFPSLFKTADRHSIESQQKYLNWIKIELGLMVFASFISIFSITNPTYGSTVATVSAAAFALGIIITYFIKKANLEDDWYVSRALAESAKSLTWRFVTRGIPFKSSDDVQVYEQFNASIDGIFKENKDFLQVVFADDDGLQITEKMKALRNLSFEERKELYMEDRVRNQFEWYKRKTAYNEKMATQIFRIVIALQAIAFIYSIYLISNPESLNIVSFIATFAVAFLSWMQVKRHQELSKSYAVTANEIKSIINRASFINEEDFAGFITDSENAFSREHTLWMAKRDVLL